jgi:isoquinoline 1-oxidoreductase beta subunit
MLLDRLANSLLDRAAASIDATGLSRRTFLTASAAAGGGLLLSIGLPRATLPAEAAEAGSFAPNAFIRIGRDDKITLVMPYAEMGQGTDTSIAMLIAEELEVGLDQVQIEHATGDDKLYTNPLIGEQVTGGSTAVRASWDPMRQAGAAARMMLIAAAAQAWQVEATECHAEKGTVFHAASNRRAPYGDLADKAAGLPVPGKVALKDPKDFTLVGTPAKRTDSPGKVNGTAMYGLDVRPPGLKVATVAACPVIGGKLGSVDDSQAKAVKGVRQIVRLDDAVAVVADHMGAAKKGLAALQITWDEGANAHVSTADIVAQLEAAAAKPGAVARQEGDVDAALKAAASKFEADYHLPLLAHATMEPLNCTVHVQKDSCDVWVGNQVQNRARAAAARITGLPFEKVQDHSYFLCGGFGRRLEIDYVEQAVRIAQQVDGPVKVIWTREEDIQHDVYRGNNFSRFRAGLDANGMPVSFEHRVVGPAVMARFLPVLFKDGVDLDIVDNAAGPYGYPNLRIDYVRQEMPTGLATGNWRGVGVTRNTAVVEGFIDELAHNAGKDPVEYRRALLDKDPRARAVLDLAAQKSGWGQPMPAGSGRGISLLLGFGTYMAQVAEVAVDKNGQVAVKRVVCAYDCGMIVNPDTIKAQIEGGIMYGLSAALYGEITLKDGRVEQSNFDSYQVLRINEAPAIEVYRVENSEAPGGMGEPATSGIAPAVVNAVFAATGKRLRKLPIDASQLKSA